MRFSTFILSISTSYILYTVTCLALPPSFHIRNILSESGDDHLCGRQLVEALFLVCHGSYNTPNKRSYSFDNDPLLRSEEMHEFLNEGEIISDHESDFFDSKAAFSLLGGSKRNIKNGGVYFFRSIRGVTDECCHKSCTIRELKQYCKHDKRQYDDKS